MKNDELVDAPVGTRIWFRGEKRPYRVRARNDRYMVCTKPFNLRHTVLYTVVDLEAQIRGTENLVFGMGAETDEECREMIERLETESEVSYRNRVRLRVARIERTE